MTTRISRMFRQNEAGFTLIEMMVALVLVSIVAIGAAAGIFHLLNTNSTNANTVTLTENINSATDYLRDDVLMTQVDVTAADPADQGIGETETEWLWLEWTLPDPADPPNLDLREDHWVGYEIKEDGRLYRTHKIYSKIYDSGILQSETLKSETSTMIAQCINAEGTFWELDSEEVTVEITITASLDGYKSSTQSRTIQVSPRTV